MVVEHGAHAAPLGPGHNRVALVQRTLLHEHGRDRAAATVQTALDDRTFGGTVRVGAQLKHFGLEQNGFFQFVEPEFFQRRNFNILGLAAHLFDDDLVLQQLLADPVGVGTGAVDLVDRHDQRHAGGLSMFDRLDRLRHHAIVGGDNQHHDVGGRGTARAHGGEGLMARRVEEGDQRAGRCFHLIGADMLGDATGLTGSHGGLAQGIQQAGLAVVDMAHDGDDRRARLQIMLFILLALQPDLHVGIRHAAGFMAEFAHHQLGGVGIDILGDGRHHAHLHQGAHNLAAGGGHTVGQLLHGDGLGQNDFADHFFTPSRRAQQFQLGLAAFAVTLAAHGGERTHFFIGTLKGGLHVDAPAAAVAVAEFFNRRYGRAALGRNGGRAAHTGAARGLVVILGTGGAAAGFQLQGFAHGRGGRAGRAGGLRRLGCWLCHGGGHMFGAGGLGGFAGGGFGYGAGFGVLKRLAGGVLLAAAGLLGGGEDGDFFLLAAFGLALGGHGQHALAGGLLIGGEGARGRGRWGAGARRRGRRGYSRGGRGGCRGGGALGRGRAQREGDGCRRRWRAGRGRAKAALLAHFHLHNPSLSGQAKSFAALNRHRQYAPHPRAPPGAARACLWFHSGRCRQ